MTAPSRTDLDPVRGAHEAGWRGRSRALALRVAPEIRGLAGFLGIAGLVLGFGLLAEKVSQGGTAAFDRHVLLLFRDPADLRRVVGPAWLLETLRDLTSLGSTVVLGLLVLLVATYLAMRRKWADFALVLAAVLSGQVASLALKLVFVRARPDLVPGAPQVFTTSFPSAHAMLSAVTYLTLGVLLSRLETHRACKRYFIAVAMVLTLTVGASRVVLGVHWPTDVLAGWCVGAAWALLCSLVAIRLQGRGKLETLS